MAAIGVLSGLLAAAVAFGLEDLRLFAAATAVVVLSTGWHFRTRVV